MNLMRSKGKELVDLGFDILPIKKGQKRPAIKDWPNEPNDPVKWARIFPGCGIGIRTKKTPAIDVDVKDKAVSRKLLEAIIGILEIDGTDAPIRVGQAPKFLIPTFSAEAITKRFSNEYKSPDGTKHRIEILGDGQQFVAFGTHPETQAEFKWPRGKLSDVLSLPDLSPEKIKAIFKAFDNLVPADWKLTDSSQTESTSEPESPKTLLERAKQPLDITGQKIKETMADLSPDMHHDKWVKIGMALHHQFEGSSEGFQIWDSWSQGSDKYDAQAAKDKWLSFETNIHKNNPVTFASALRMAAISKPEPKPPSLFFKSAAELTQNIGSIKWLIKGWMEAQTMSCIFGDPGSFKSFVAIDQAFSIATGTRWMGCEVDKGAVLYIAGEGHGGIGRRALAWCIDKEIDPNDVSVYFSTAAADVYNKEAAVDLTIKIDEMVAQIDKPIKAIYFDTLARNMGAGDENSTADMNTFINHMDRFIKNKYGCSVVLIHHSGHKDKHRARGSSAFLGALDHNIRCQKLGDLKASLAATKMKDAPEPDDLFIDGRSVYLGNDDEGNAMDSLVFEYAQPPVKNIKELTPKQQTVLDTITAMADHDGVYYEVLKTDIYAEMQTKGIYAEGRRVSGILERLVEAGKVSDSGQSIKVLIQNE